MDANVSYVRSMVGSSRQGLPFYLSENSKMPTFFERIPTKQTCKGWDLKRTPVSGGISGIITCEKLVATQTHFWGGRTVPCEGEVCKACLAIVPSRWHIYVSAFNPKTREHFIFECTGIAGQPLEDYFEANKTLRGCFFGASRPKCKPNAKVFIETKPMDLAKIVLPPAPDLIRALCTVWQVPAGPIDGLKEGESARLPKKNGKAISKMREHEFNGADPLTMGSILKNAVFFKED